MPIPRHFCWSKFGVEAGEGIQSIIARKEAERIGNDGIFLWGIGNAIGPSIASLLHHIRKPEVLFTPIRSKPRAVDVKPEIVVAWMRGETIDGSDYELPPASFVTSRAPRPGKAHYALVCRSECVLSVTPGEDAFYSGQLRNLRSGNAVGFSQVTSVVSRDARLPEGGAEYAVAMRAFLVFPYFVRLCDPVVVPSTADISDPAIRQNLRQPTNGRSDSHRSRQLMLNVH